MNVLVTGAAGRLGSVVAEHLQRQGLAVRATDQRSRADLSVPVVVESLLLPEACYRLLEGVDTLVHLANHPNAGSANPQRVFGENCTMNGNILQAAVDMGVKRVVFASSIQAIAGRHTHSPSDLCQLPYLPLDGHMPANPGNLYAASKVATEQLLASYCKFDGLHAVAIRFPFLYGEHAEARQTRRPRWWQNGDEPWGRPEAFSALSYDSAAALVHGIVTHPWSGFRIAQPANANNTTGLSARDAYQRYLATVPLRIALDDLTTLVDCTDLERDFAWPQPGKDIAPVSAQAEG